MKITVYKKKMILSKDLVIGKKNSINFPSKIFIDGMYRDSVTSKSFENISPINGKTINQIAFTQKEDVDLAVKSAKRVFNKGSWSKADISFRKKVMLKFAILLEEYQLELAILDTVDVGKTINDTYNSDLPASIDNIRWYAEIIDKIYDDIAPTPQKFIGMITKEPIGVVGAIVPWNYPLWMAIWKLAPALITGNSVILKPAEQSPMSAIKIAELFIEAGLPEGVLNVLPGDGEVTGKSLCLHNEVDCIAFTGSGEVGKLILGYSGQSNMKRIQLECGGKSPNIVFADHDDLDLVAEKSAYAIFGNQGEVCSAASRLIIQKEIEKDFIEKIISISKGMMPGDPFDPNSFMGAVVDKNQLNKIDSYVKIGKEEGANLVIGGKTSLESTGGYYYNPTIFTQVQNSMKIAREEIFGPVLTSITFNDFDEALNIANDSDYGLAAAVWTKNINTAFKMSKNLRAGTVYVNNYEEGVDSTIPLGGYKQSGIGRDNSYHALDNYLQIKSTWIKLN